MHSDSTPPLYTFSISLKILSIINLYKRVIQDSNERLRTRDYKKWDTVTRHKTDSPLKEMIKRAW